MAVTGKRNQLLARIQRLFDGQAAMQRSFDGVLASALVLALGLSLSLSSQAETFYPGIESLDDASVQRLIDDQKARVYVAPGESQFVSPPPDQRLASLSEAERAAFVGYFREALWNDSVASWERQSMWQSLSDSQWQSLKDLFFEQRFAHVLATLSDPARQGRVETGAMADVEGVVESRVFAGERWELRVPLAALERIFLGDQERVSAGAAQVFRDDDRLVMALTERDDVEDWVYTQAIIDPSAQLSRVPVDMVFNTFSNDAYPGPDGASFFADAGVYQVSLSEKMLIDMLAGEPVSLGTAMAGIRATAEGQLEMAFEPLTNRQINRRISAYVPKGHMHSPERTEETLAVLLEQLPSSLHDYLYTDEQLARWVMAAELRRGMPLGEGEAELRQFLSQHLRAEALLEAAQSPEDDALAFARQGRSTWVGDNIWILIRADDDQDPASQLTVEIDTQPLSEVLPKVAAQCESLAFPEVDAGQDRPVSLYGPGASCSQLHSALKMMVAGGPELSFRN